MVNQHVEPRPYLQERWLRQYASQLPSPTDNYWSVQDAGMWLLSGGHPALSDVKLCLLSDFFENSGGTPTPHQLPHCTK